MDTIKGSNFDIAVKTVLEKQSDIAERTHSENTREWLFKLNSNPSKEVQLAALAHDIDRSIKPRILQGETETYNNYKVRHSERSSQLIGDILRNLNFEDNFVLRVMELVKFHELGGDKEMNLLQDADSISYFDKNLEGYVARNTKEKTEAKMKWMYERCSARAKRYINSLKTYQKIVLGKEQQDGRQSDRVH
jgi:hypothetical protein